MKHLVTFIATGAYSGYVPPWPGTTGSIPPVLLAALFLKGDLYNTLIAAIAVCAISAWAAGEGEKILGHDHRSIVIDEWAGMLIAICFVPFTWANYAIAFFLFRFFDVAKLFPANKAETLPGGWGITMDDIVAGIQANIVLQLWLIVQRTWFA